MLQSIRESYNSNFSLEKYNSLLSHFEKNYPGQLDFRVAETPVFLDKALKNKMISCCDSIIEVIQSDTFATKIANSIPKGCKVPNENNNTSFLAIDFAICTDKNGQKIPQLIELQGFPSVFGLQYFLAEAYKSIFKIPENFNYLQNVNDSKQYFEKLRALIVGDQNPENVILLEIFPEKQKTRIDFVITAKMLGIKILCLTKIKKENQELFYENEGKKIRIKRIYNRLIFDELQSYKNLELEWHPTQDVDVEWVGHPNWYFKISKFLMPFLKHEYIPATQFLASYEKKFPSDLENFVLKPLFSFAGSGVILNVTKKLLSEIPDPENYILQKKVKYEPVIEALAGSVKCEVRMLYIWEQNAAKPELLTNLARLSRGEMIGVRFNKDFDWVGGSVSFMEI